MAAAGDGCRRRLAVVAHRGPPGGGRGLRPRPGLRGRAAGSWRTRRASAARPPGAARASRATAGPRPSILRLSSWRPSRAATTTASSRVGQRVDQGGDDVEVAGPGQGPGGDLAEAGVAVGQQLAEAVLVRPEHGRALGLVAGDQPDEGRVGVLGAGVLEHGEHPLDRAVHRPADDPAAGDRQAREVLGQPAAAEQRPRAEPLDLDPRESSWRSTWSGRGSPRPCSARRRGSSSSEPSPRCWLDG